MFYVATSPGVAVYDDVDEAFGVVLGASGASEHLMRIGGRERGLERESPVCEPRRLRGNVVHLRLLALLELQLQHLGLALPH